MKLVTVETPIFYVNKIDPINVSLNPNLPTNEWKKIIVETFTKSIPIPKEDEILYTYKFNFLDIIESQSDESYKGYLLNINDVCDDDDDKTEKISLLDSFITYLNKEKNMIIQNENLKHIIIDDYFDFNSNTIKRCTLNCEKLNPSIIKNNYYIIKSMIPDSYYGELIYSFFNKNIQDNLYFIKSVDLYNFSNNSEIIVEYVILPTIKTLSDAKWK